jgi:hypothetical protein
VLSQRNENDKRVVLTGRIFISNRRQSFAVPLYGPLSMRRRLRWTGDTSHVFSTRPELLKGLIVS